MAIWVMLMGLVGYECKIEGYDKGRCYIGVYGQDVEYGWVVSKDGIYLDTVMNKCPR
jgi:hypothetical protein